jgi:large subunit ribosomal protein L21
MSLIVSSGSNQYVVDYGQQIIVDRLSAKENETVELPVLLAFGDGKIDDKVKSVKAKVVAHQKGEKLRILKFKQKSNYKKQYGYRHYETVLEILK